MDVIGGPDTSRTAAEGPTPSPASPVAAYLIRLAPSSRRTQRAALDTVASVVSAGVTTADGLEWHTLTAGQTESLARYLAGRYATVTVQRMMVALRGVLRASWEQNLMDAQAYHEAIAAIPPIRWSTLPRGRLLSDAEIAALFAACAADTSAAGPRDAALLTVLYAAGLRRSEAAALDVREYQPKTGALTVRATLKSRARTLYTADGSARTLERWLEIRRGATGPMFVAINKGGRLPARPERMHEQSIYRALVKRARQAGLEPFTGQDLRRTFITRLIEGGADIATVQRLAGHCSPATTQRYDRRSEAVHRQSARMLPVPEIPASADQQNNVPAGETTQ